MTGVNECPNRPATTVQTSLHTPRQTFVRVAELVSEHGELVDSSIALQVRKQILLLEGLGDLAHKQFYGVRVLPRSRRLHRASRVKLLRQVHVHYINTVTCFEHTRPTCKRLTQSETNTHTQRQDNGGGGSWSRVLRPFQSLPHESEGKTVTRTVGSSLGLAQLGVRKNKLPQANSTHSHRHVLIEIIKTCN